MTRPATGSALQPRGGVWEGEFSRQIFFAFFRFFCVFEMLIFMFFCFFWKRPPFPAGTKILKKMFLQTSWNFSKTGKGQADVGQTSGDVGQTSGKRRARRALDIGQASGKHRARRANFWRWKFEKKRKKTPAGAQVGKHFWKKGPVLWCQKVCEN